MCSTSSCSTSHTFYLRTTQGGWNPPLYPFKHLVRVSSSWASLPPPTLFPTSALSLTNLMALPFHLRGIFFFVCLVHRLRLPRVCQLPQRLGICKAELIKQFLLFILKLVLPAGLFDCRVCPGPKHVAFPRWLLSPQTCCSVPIWEGPSSSPSGGELTFGHPHLAFCDFSMIVTETSGAAAVFLLCHRVL